MIRRAAHLLLYAGIAATIALLSKLHASVVAAETYDFTNSFRLPAAIGLGFMFAVAAYLSGFPDQSRRLRPTLGAAVMAVSLAAVGFSLVQFAVGAALLPRFVVVVSMAVLGPWFVLCSRLDRGGRARANDRDRVVVVGHPEETAALSLEVEHARSEEHTSELQSH